MNQKLTLDLFFGELARRGITLSLRAGKITPSAPLSAGHRNTMKLLESEILAHLLTQEQAPPSDKNRYHHPPHSGPSPVLDEQTDTRQHQLSDLPRTPSSTQEHPIEPQAAAPARPAHKEGYPAALERFTYLAMHHKVAVDTPSRLVVIQPSTAHLAAELYTTAPWGVIHLDGQPWQKWGTPPEEVMQIDTQSSRSSAEYSSCLRDDYPLRWSTHD